MPRNFRTAGFCSAAVCGYVFAGVNRLCASRVPPTIQGFLECLSSAFMEKESFVDRRDPLRWPTTLLSAGNSRTATTSSRQKPQTCASNRRLQSSAPPPIRHVRRDALSDEIAATSGRSRSRASLETRNSEFRRNSAHIISSRAVVRPVATSKT